MRYDLMVSILLSALMLVGCSSQPTRNADCPVITNKVERSILQGQIRDFVIARQFDEALDATDQAIAAYRQGLREIDCVSRISVDRRSSGRPKEVLAVEFAENGSVLYGYKAAIFLAKGDIDQAQRASTELSKNASFLFELGQKFGASKFKDYHNTSNLAFAEVAGLVNSFLDNDEVKELEKLNTILIAANYLEDGQSKKALSLLSGVEPRAKLEHDIPNGHVIPLQGVGEFAARLAVDIQNKKTSPAKIRVAVTDLIVIFFKEAGKRAS